MKAAADTIWDVIIIGGGPAGMMAAVQAGERGKRVLLLEKNVRLGKKLSITGGGRCNVTNNKTVVREMLNRYGDAGKFLFSTYTQHGVTESVSWFAERGVELHEENEGRLFPVTNRAETICQTLEQSLVQPNITVEKGVAVKRVTQTQQGRFLIEMTSGFAYVAKACVIATGGYSRPDTGSTGEGFDWLEGLGHNVAASSLALVPLVLKELRVKDLSGLTQPDVKITLFADQQKQLTVTGKILFTHVGVSGPTILNMSSAVGQLLRHSTVTLSFDFFPVDDVGALRAKLTKLLEISSNQKIQNSLAQWLPKTLIKVILQELQIDGETPVHSVSSTDRRRIVDAFKGLKVTVARLLGADKAVISGGGVDLTEVDFRTMQSRIIPGLYLIGDVLNVNRPSGGYSLQLCWSSGWVAGNSV